MEPTMVINWVSKLDFINHQNINYIKNGQLIKKKIPIIKGKHINEKKSNKLQIEYQKKKVLLHATAAFIAEWDRELSVKEKVYFKKEGK